jgi:hypothetical protein
MKKGKLNKAVKQRSASLHWTEFKSRLCGFAAQKYSTKPRFKFCRLPRRYVLFAFGFSNADVSQNAKAGRCLASVCLYLSNIKFLKQRIASEFP